MAFAGIRGTGSFGTDERPTNFRNAILRLNPNGSAPLTALFDKMRKESTDDPKISWWEEDLNNPRFRVASEATSGVTTLTLSASGTAGTWGDAFDLAPGDVLIVEHEPVDGQAFNGTNYERLQVIAVPASATSIVVKRGYGGSTAATIAAGTFLTKLGSAFAEGSRSPATHSRNPTELYNYCQIFKTPYEVTATAMKTNFRTGDPMKNDRIRKMFAHASSMEMQFIFGQRSITNGSTGNPERTCNGILAHLSTNLNVYATPPSEDQLLDDFTPMFNVEGPLLSDERIAFCGNGFLNCLNKVIKASPSTRIQFDGVLDVYGMKFQKYIMPFGTVAFKTHPLWNNHARYNNSCLVVAPMGLRYRPLRDTFEQKNIQGNDEDTVKNQWLTEASIEVNHERAHGFYHITDTSLPA